MAPPGSTFDKLFASGFGAVIKVAHASQIVKDKSYEQLARRGGFALNAIDSAKVDRPEKSGHFRGNGGDRHAVRFARGP